MINADHDGSLSDPFLVLYKKDNKNETWKKVGNTEIIHDNLNPEFVTKVIVDWHFEEPEMFKAEVYDSDVDKVYISNLGSHDFLGALEFWIHDVVTSEDQAYARPLVKENVAEGAAGRIFISA